MLSKTFQVVQNAQTNPIKLLNMCIMSLTESMWFSTSASIMETIVESTEAGL